MHRVDIQAQNRALVVAGAGRYADPWHPFGVTSDRLAEILKDAGFAVERSDDVDGALANLDGVDLLIVNAGDPWRNGETGRGAPSASIAGLSAAIENGIGIIGVHNAISSLRDYPSWRHAIGGDWLVDVSMHPKLGPSRVNMNGSAHEVVADFVTLPGNTHFDVVDERYTNLVVDDTVTPLAHHELDGKHHPLLWVQEVGRTRVVYDALGHDLRSYESDVHVEIFQRAARWATRSI